MARKTSVPKYPSNIKAKLTNMKKSPVEKSPVKSAPKVKRQASSRIPVQ